MNLSLKFVLACSRLVRSCTSMALLFFGLFVVNNLLGDRMFSLLTLQPTHSIGSFAELADIVDVIPLTYRDYIWATNYFQETDLVAINRSRSYLTYWDVRATELIKPDRVFIDNEMNTVMLFESLKGLPIKLADEKLIFILDSKFPIITTDTSDKMWLMELKKR